MLAFCFGMVGLGLKGWRHAQANSGPLRILKGFWRRGSQQRPLDLSYPRGRNAQYLGDRVRRNALLKQNPDFPGQP